MTWYHRTSNIHKCLETPSLDSPQSERRQVRSTADPPFHHRRTVRRRSRALSRAAGWCSPGRIWAPAPRRRSASPAARSPPPRAPAPWRTAVNGGGRRQIHSPRPTVQAYSLTYRKPTPYFERFLHSTLIIFFINCSTDINPAPYFGLCVGPSIFTL